MDIVKDDEWGLYPNFKRSEFECHHTGLCEMTHKFMALLQQVRNQYGKPMIINSGYRDLSHPVERSKHEPGEHTLGLAADIRVYGTDAMQLVHDAVLFGFMRIGVSQKGELSARYIHLGLGNQENKRFPVAIWSY